MLGIMEEEQVRIMETALHAEESGPTCGVTSRIPPDVKKTRLKTFDKPLRKPLCLTCA